MNFNSVSPMFPIVHPASGLILVCTLASAPLLADETELEVNGQKHVPEAKQSDPVKQSEPEKTRARDAGDLHVKPLQVEPFQLLGNNVVPGSMRRLSWSVGMTTIGLDEVVPVIVAHGTRPGPALCLTAAVHGDELNGIEIVRNLLHDIKPKKFRGTIIGVPIVNLSGYREGSRYLPDRRDLNRHFPGHPEGSTASRIAHSFFDSIIRKCDYLVDLHTGSFRRINLPQLRADLNDEEVVYLTKGFGATAVIHKDTPDGSLRGAAAAAGITAVVMEVGEPGRLQPGKVDYGVKALRSLLSYLDLMPQFRRWDDPQPVYYNANWVRADNKGILSSVVKLGQKVKKGELLGTVIDPITNKHYKILSPYNGQVMGMAPNQTVRPGYAAYHIGIGKTRPELVKKRDAQTAETEKADDNLDSERDENESAENDASE